MSATKRKLWELKSFQATVASVVVTLIGIAVSIWLEKSKPDEQPARTQILANPIHGPQNIQGDNNTQVVSNITNVQTDDHRSQSPTLSSNVISNSGTLSIGSTLANSGFSNVAKVNYGPQSGDSVNNYQTGSGKMFNGGGTDNSSTITTSNYVINNFYSQATNAAPGASTAAAERPSLPSENKETINAITSPEDFPGFGKPWQVSLGQDGLKRGGMGYYKEIPVRVTQGDRLRVRAQPVGGAAMLIRMAVHVGPRDTEFEKPRKSRTLDWTMTKGIPGNSASVRIYSMEAGSVTVTISKAE